MFCARCGQQIPEASIVCPLCGREATIHVPQQNYAQVDVAVVSAPQIAAGSSKPIRKDLQGVGGWLLFFCIATTILTPLRVFNTFFTSPAAPQFDAGTMVIAAIAVFGVIVGVTIWTRSALAIPLLRVFFLVMGGWALFNLSVLLAVGSRAVDELTVLAHVRTLIFVAVWAAYFHNSERVRATLGRNL
jgi:hypothetical protein